ncbi:MAG TPA: signal peptidase I [Longimicrobiaceae bacterium]|nr:signal peptidase I [Longimicrobiaceae bacterium]
MDSSTPYGRPGELPQPRILSERVFDERRKTADESRGSISTGRWMWEWFKAISTAVLLFLTIRTFVVEAFKIPTGSMERTLLVGDFLLVNKAVYGAEVPGTHTRFPAFAVPERGDVIVFLPPHDPAKNYVKRLVGLPGDTLEMRDKVLYLNGEPQAEPYVRHIDPITDPSDPQMLWQISYLEGDRKSRRGYRPTRDNWGPIVVPEGKVFTLGDNRDNSEDSRYWGFVDKESIKGRPILVYYSFEKDLARSFDWLTGVRWGRIGSLIT